MTKMLKNPKVYFIVIFTLATTLNVVQTADFTLVKEDVSCDSTEK